MKNDYTGDQSNMNSNHYGGYSNNYGNPQYYNHGSYRYGGNSGSGSYGYGSYGNISEEQGPQRNFKDYIFLIRERIWYLIIVFFIIFLVTNLGASAPGIKTPPTKRSHWEINFSKSVLSLN